MAAELVLRGEGGLRGMLAPLKAHVIDAQSLDADLMRVLQGMWSEVCAQAGTRLCTSLQPELDGLLRGALWYLSMWRCSATLGQQMQNLHCVAANSAHLPEARARSGAALELATPSLKASGLPAAVVPRDRRLLFGLLTVLLPWAWSRASRAMADPDHPERLRWSGPEPAGPDPDPVPDPNRDPNRDREPNPTPAPAPDPDRDPGHSNLTRWRLMRRLEGAVQVRVRVRDGVGVRRVRVRVRGSLNPSPSP